MHIRKDYYEQTSDYDYLSNTIALVATERAVTDSRSKLAIPLAVPLTYNVLLSCCNAIAMISVIHETYFGTV